MRIGINENDDEQLEKHDLSERSFEHTSPKSEITDGEKERLAETTPNIKGSTEIDHDDSAKLSHDGPKLDKDKRDAENTASITPTDGETTERLESQESKEAEGVASLSEAMNDPKLFTDHKPMDYTYSESDNGKQAYGQLGLSEDSHRNPKAQREAGGEERRDDDDGGHLIGARYDGLPDSENIDAQNRNLNRGAYKCEENNWSDALKNDDKVYVNIETYKREGKERLDAYMGWSVTEHSDGTREWDAFSCTNESNKVQDKWAAELEKLPDTDDGSNAMIDDNYDRVHQIIDEETNNW